MAVIHPHLYRSTSKQGGYLRELELLDLIVVSAQGHLLALEVKTGGV